MKRFLCMILILALCASIGACGDSEQTANDSPSVPDGFCVGYGKVEITPKESVPLQGFGNVTQRMSTGYLDRLYTCCVAITDEDGNTVLLFGSDLTTTVKSVADEIRRSISGATGVPEDHIFLNASHSHSAPATDTVKVPSQMRYNTSLVKWMTEAAVQAMADRKEAEMYIGAVEIQGQNFVRHYVLQDGTSVGYDSMARNMNPIDHAGVGDHTMQLLKFTRKGGKDVLISNWQVHPTRTGSASDYDASADIVGVLRSTLEQELDCHAVYFQGAAGNMNPISFVKGEEVSEDYREQGRQIAQQVIDAEETLFAKVSSGKIRIAQKSFTAKVDHTQDHLYSYAIEVQQVWQSTNNRSKADAAGAPYGIRSPYHANKIVSASKKGESADVELNVFAVGNVAFATCGFEMFAQNGMLVKENSPYEMTFFMGYTNEHNGYLPTTAAFEYEAYESDITQFECGTGEKIAQELVSMLEQLKNEG